MNKFFNGFDLGVFEMFVIFWRSRLWLFIIHHRQGRERSGDGLEVL